MAMPQPLTSHYLLVRYADHFLLSALFPAAIDPYPFVPPFSLIFLS